MPKAILALRSYPLAILMALVLFACSLVIATSSIGKISNGGDDQGSGMGGTGRTGTFGDSGFGGTGGPNPFFGGTDSTTDDSEDALNQPLTDDWPAPWLQREQETAGIPEEMRPLIELQRNPPQDPYRDSPANQGNPSLHILDPVTAPLPPHTQRILEMANSEAVNDQPVLEMEIRIPENLPAPDADAFRFQFELAEQQAPAVNDTPTAIQDLEQDSSPSGVLSNVGELAGLPEAEEELPVIEAVEDRRNNPERIQRPELPPFQRMRPAVDRSSVTPPRVQPMRI